MSSASNQLVLQLNGAHYFLLRRLHSLTGVVFAGYLAIHLLVNATIAEGGPPGREMYQVQVNRIHDLPLLRLIEWALVFAPILYHAIHGIWITLGGQPNTLSYPFGRNWLYLMQRMSAVVVLLFVLFHVLALKYGAFGARLAFEPGRAMTSIVRHMTASPLVAWVVYPLGILAACFHAANGIWTAGITWGLTTSADAQRRWGILATVVFAALFAAGMTALVASVRAG